MKHKKTSQLLLALLVLGSSFLISGKVHASTLYYQNNNSVDIGQTGTTWIQIGNFIGDGTTLDTNTELAYGVDYLSLGNCAGGGQGLTIAISTETDLNSNPGNRFDFAGSASISSGYQLAYSDFATIGSQTLTNGVTYYIYFNRAAAYTCNFNIKTDTNGDMYGYITTNGSPAPDLNDTTTRIDTISPPNASTTGYTTTLNATGYINEDDYETGTILRLRLVNNTLQNGIGGSALDAWNSAFGGYSIPITSAGAFDLSTTTTFDIDGQVNIEWSIQVPNTTWLIGSFLSPQVLVSTTTYFIVNQMTGLDIAMASTTDILISALVTGTTTQSVIRCNPANFDITVCLISLLIPPRSVLENDLTNFKNDVLVRFPIGYVTRFLTILGSGATSSLPVFSATIPDALPFGQGQTITLDLNHSLDWILYATTSAYITAEASSTDTLYDITSYYWNIMVYMALGFYILRRIIGAHLIPDLFYSTESIVSTRRMNRRKRSDDSYKLKEKLYEMSKRK